VFPCRGNPTYKTLSYQREEKMPKINILKEAEKVKKPYTPYHLANVDNYHVFLGLFEGDYKKHKHPYDEFFYVVLGEIEIEMDKETVTLKEGEGILVKKNTWHKSKAKDKAVVMLFEKIGMQSDFA
jgi:mannose-6-phosphate isomerase-like protein (cupin superfamily)